MIKILFAKLTREHELMAPMPVWIAELFKWVVLALIVVYSLLLQLVVAEWIFAWFSN